MKVTGSRKDQPPKKLKTFIDLIAVRMQNSEIGVTSSVVAYYLLLSFFPLLIAVGNILPLFHFNQNQVLTMLKTMMPQEIFLLFAPSIKALLTSGSKELLSISAVATLWSASKSINALQIAMNKAYGVNGTTNYLVMRIVSMLMLILFFVAVVGVVLVIGFTPGAATCVGNLLGGWIQDAFGLDWMLAGCVMIGAVGLVVVLLIPGTEEKVPRLGSSCAIQ